MLVFVLIACAGIFWGPATLEEKLYDLRRMRFFLLYVVLFYYLYFYSSHLWISVLWKVACVVGVYGFIQHFIAIDLFRPEGRKVLLYAIPDGKIGPLVVGTFNHHLTFVNIYFLYASIFFALGMFFWSKRGMLRLFLPFGVFLFILCIWTQSRIAWFAIPVVIYFMVAHWGKKAALIAMGSTLGILVLFYFIDAGFRQRFDRTFLDKDAFYSWGPENPRQRLWKAQIAIFREYPILGIGYNNNERQAKTYVDRIHPNLPDNFYGHAHSTPLQLLSTTGFLGFGAYLWLWFEIFCRCGKFIRKSPRDRVEKWLAVGLLGGFIGFHIQGLTQWNFGDAEVLHNLVFFWAVLVQFRLFG
jgi:O-antigen ligase